MSQNHNLKKRIRDGLSVNQTVQLRQYVIAQTGISSSTYYRALDGNMDAAVAASLCAFLGMQIEHLLDPQKPISIHASIQPQS